MKYFLTIIGLFLTTNISAQVIFGDETGTATDKTSVLLEFSKNQAKGIILPYITAVPSNPAEGSIILDASNSTEAKVKYYNGNWVELSQNTADVSSALTHQPDDVAITGVIIGSDRSDANGVLVLESTDKAMVLPTVSSTDEIINPAPGMVVYVKNDDDKLLAVFNGSQWSFWSATE